jgi:hypothetical protein
MDRLKHLRYVGVHGLLRDHRSSEALLWISGAENERASREPHGQTKAGPQDDMDAMVL